MKTLLLTGQEIIQLGYAPGRIIGVIIKIVSENYTIEQKEYVLNFLRGILKHPERFKGHKIFGEVTDFLINKDVIRKRGSRAPLKDLYIGKPERAISD